MKNKTFLFLVAALFITGCAGSKSDQKLTSLNYAYQDAKSTVEFVGGQIDADQSDKLQQARELLKNTREKQQESADPQLSEVYLRAKRLAREAYSKNLVDKLETKDEKIGSLQEKLTELETLQSNIEDIQNQLESDSDEKDSDRKENSEKYEKLKSNINELSTRLSRHENGLQNLRNSLLETSDRLVRLSQKNEKKNKTVKELKNRLNQTWEKMNTIREKNKEIKNMVREKMDEMEKENSEMVTKAREKMNKIKAENRKIKRMVKQRMEDADVKREDGKVVITLSEIINFDPGRASLSDDSLERLEAIAPTLKEYPNRMIRIYGHADSTPLSSDSEFSSNWGLSGVRAINVLKYLVYAQGLEKNRVGAVAFGDRKPEVIKQSSKNGNQDRRVEIVLIPEKMKENYSKTSELENNNETLKDKFADSVKEENLRTDQGSLLVNLTDQLEFPPAEATLDEEAKQVLDKFGQLLAETSNRPIRVQGHTDDIPLAEEESYDSNWELSGARAIAVVEYLVENYDLASRDIGAVAMGQFYPLVPNNSDENRARNRRVEIKMLPGSLESRTVDALE